MATIIPGALVPNTSWFVTAVDNNSFTLGSSPSLGYSSTCVITYYNDGNINPGDIISINGDMVDIYSVTYEGQLNNYFKNDLKSILSE